MKSYLDSIHNLACHLEVIISTGVAVFTRAVKEVGLLEQSLALMRQVQVVHIGHSDLLSLFNVAQSPQLHSMHKT